MLLEREAERGKEFPINLPSLTSLVCFLIIIQEKRRGRLEETLSRKEENVFLIPSYP